MDVEQFEPSRRRYPDGPSGRRGLVSGRLLEGVRVTEEPFEDWLRFERAKLREGAVRGLVRLLAHQTNPAGEYGRAVRLAVKLGLRPFAWLEQAKAELAAAG